MCLHHATHAAHAMSKQQRSQEVYPKTGVQNKKQVGAPAKNVPMESNKIIAIIKESV
jgi:hypothetical protein